MTALSLLTAPSSSERSRDTGGNPLCDLVGNVEPLVLRLLMEDGQQGLHVRSLCVREHSALTPRPESGLKTLDLFGQYICRENDLCSTLIEPLECVEELFLCSLLPTQELDVIDQQHRGLLAVAISELRHPSIAKSMNQFVGELLGGHVENLGLGVTLSNSISDGVDQVSLAQARVSVNEERVVVVFSR